MKLKVNEVELDFEMSSEIIAFDNNDILYPVFVSTESILNFGCYGRVKLIMSFDKQVLDLMMPLMSPKSPYSIVEIETLKRYHGLYEKTKSL